MPFIWKSMRGTDGRVEVDSVGVVCAVMRSWSLNTSEESGQGSPDGLTLRASFSYVNSAILNETTIRKSVLIEVRRGKHYRVEAERMAFDGETLVMEEAHLVPLVEVA